MTHDANEKLCQFVEMTEHDYEVNNGFYAPPDCQCVLIAKVRKETLAAAVQRVEALPWTSETWNAHAEKVAATYRVGHRDGYEEGLAAAREAVKGVNWFNDEGKMLNVIVATRESIAAIDALRKDKQ